MNKTAYLGIGCVIASLVAMLFGDVSLAVSAHDDDYRRTNSVQVKGSVCASVDITDDWSKYILEENRWTIGNSTSRAEVKNSFLQALNNGRWAVSEMKSPSGLEQIVVYWTEDDELSVQWSQGVVWAMAPPYQGNYVYISASNSNQSGDCIPSVSTWGLGDPWGGYSAIMSREENEWIDIRNLFIFTDHPNYPTGYEGELINTLDEWSDIDGDNLVAAEEIAQGTSDLSKDSDSDGLNDYIESEINEDREDIFCGVSQCAYPDPTKKDIYLELDWMKNGATTYKPTQTQLDLVKDMFTAKNINLHIDTGQYGGGNELATYTANLPNTDRENEVDAGDYKLGGDGISANFSADRELIWRYMIAGDKFIEGEDTVPSDHTGWAEVLGDQSFIAMGALSNVSGPASADRMIANTVAHELGHNLCLASTQYYVEQPEECAYGGIDNDDTNDSQYHLLNYESVMNYRYQLTDFDDTGVVDYSNGTHGTGDHNDWAGVALGIKGFSGERTEINAQRGGTGYLRSPDGTIIAQ